MRNCNDLIKDLFNHKITSYYSIDLVRRLCYYEINDYVKKNPIHLDYNIPAKSNLNFDYYRFMNYPWSKSDESIFSKNKKNDFYDNLFRRDSSKKIFTTTGHYPIYNDF